MSKSWEETFMRMAIEIARRSHCFRAQIGAVIAHMEPGRQSILTFGYNGPPRGIEHCDETECTNRFPDGSKIPKGYCRGAHAEMNAILNAAREGICIEGATLFVTLSPCVECAKHILNSGLREVVWLEKYSDRFSGKEEETERALQLIGKTKSYRKLIL